MMIVVTWNTRGVGKNSKSQMLKNVIAREKADFVMIQETKLKVVEESKARALSGK